MTASVRFLFFLAVLTFLGCSSDEKPATDPAPPQDAAQQEAESEAALVPPTSNNVSTDQTPLLSSETLDLEKEAGDPSPLEPTPPAPRQAMELSQEKALLPPTDPMAPTDKPLTKSLSENYQGSSYGRHDIESPSGSRKGSKYPEYVGLGSVKTQPPELPPTKVPPPESPTPESPATEGPSPSIPSPEMPPLELPAPQSPAPETPPSELPSPETPLPEAPPVEMIASETASPEKASPEVAPAETLSLKEIPQEPMVPIENPSAEPALPPAEPGPASTETPEAAPASPSEPGSHTNPLRDGEMSNTLRSSHEMPLGPGTTAPTATEVPATDMATLADPGKTSSNGRPNSKGEPFDPIKENGPIFEGWPKPELVLLMTGRQNGYIEPCGCAGMERMKGGLTRRDTMIRDLVENRKWPVVALDLGNQVKGHKRQTELKFHHTAESLLAMGYEGVGLGIADLQLSAGEVAAITSNENSPFVSANIDFFEPGTEMIAKYRVIERNGIKVGVTAVLGDSFRKQLNNKSIPTTDPVQAIEQVAKYLKNCEVRVLLAYADREESEALAKRFPMFHVVVTAAGGPQPPKNSVVVAGTKTYLVEVGEKGESVIALGLYRDRETPVRYQRVTLDSRFAGSERIHRLMSMYQDQLKILGLEGLNLKPVPCPEAKTKGKYVGSKACEICHEQSYDIWRKSKHAKAWKTLVEADPPRNHDPECISCHVIGWDPQRYYPLESGFISSVKTPELENVGCESCHGPGGAHVKAEEGGDMELQERLQKAMIVTIEESRSHPQKMCYNCHDLDNSPEFNFDKYWPDVKHYETESGEKEDDE